MNTSPQPPKMNQWTIAIIWIILLLATTYIFNGVIDDINNPNQRLNVSVNEHGQREIVLQRNRSGHYVVAGKINGRDVDFLLDTGATLVSIPEHIATKLQLTKGRGFKTETANGTSQSYTTKLDRISIGDITISNVEGGISSGMDFDEILLGMSFLKHLNMTQRGKTLILSVPH